MRILMINYCTIGQNNATGQTMKNIFLRMENAKILQYTFNPYAFKIET